MNVPAEKDHEAMNVVRRIFDLSTPSMVPGGASRPPTLTEAGKIVRAAIDEATAGERLDCEQVAREFIAAPTDPEQEQVNDTAESIADAIEAGGDDAPTTWLRILRAERDVALAMHCDLWGLGTHAQELAPCERCAGCLSAINLAVDVWAKDEAEQAVEDAPMGCVACHRAVPMTHLDGFIGHNVPAFKKCPVKRAEL